MRYCPHCGAEVEDNAINCPNCFRELSRVNITASTGWQPQGSGKSPIVALILAIIPGLFGLWGIGHFYLGRWERGIMFLITGLVLYLLVLGSSGLMAIPLGFIVGAACLVIFALIWVAGFIYQAFEAYALAR